MGQAQLPRCIDALHHFQILGVHPNLAEYTDLTRLYLSHGVCVNRFEQPAVHILKSVLSHINVAASVAYLIAFTSTYTVY